MAGTGLYLFLIVCHGQGVLVHKFLAADERNDVEYDVWIKSNTHYCQHVPAPEFHPKN